MPNPMRSHARTTKAVRRKRLLHTSVAYDPKHDEIALYRHALIADRMSGARPILRTMEICDQAILELKRCSNGYKPTKYDRLHTLDPAVLRFVYLKHHAVLSALVEVIHHLGQRIAPLNLTNENTKLEPNAYQIARFQDKQRRDARRATHRSRDARAERRLIGAASRRPANALLGRRVGCYAPSTDGEY